MEFTSIGGLLPGVHKDDILMGLSICRNKKLAEVFYRLELIEAYGTGMMKIKNAYKDRPEQPEVHISTNAFKIILPRIQDDTNPLSSTDERATLFSYLKQHHSITRKEAEALLGTSQSTVTRLFNQLINENLLQRIGRGKGTRYLLP